MKISRAHLAFCHDIGMAFLSLILAFYLRVGSDIYYNDIYWPVLLYSVPLFTVIAAVCFQAIGMYRGIWRYASIPDLKAIFKASTYSILIFVAIFFIATRLHNFPRSVPAIHWLLLMVMLGGPRLLYRLWRDRRLEKMQETHNKIPVVLIGSGDEAQLFIRAVMNSENQDYKVIAILDEKGKRAGYSLLGLPIFALEKGQLKFALDTIESKTKQRAQKIIFTRDMDASDKDFIQSLDKESEELGISLARLPSLTQFKKAVGEGELSVEAFAIEDLLGRAQARLDYDSIKGMIKGKKVLVTGAGGTIGSELTHQIAGFSPKSLVLVDHAEFNLYTIDMELKQLFPDLEYRAALANIRDRDRIMQIFEDYKPEIVFHAAALKHVPIVELNPEEGVLTNLTGTKNVVDAACEQEAEIMVQISTDKAVNPTNVMGASKRLGELYAQSLDLKQDIKTRFVTVRFGNVLGSSGSVVPLFRSQLERGGPLTVTHPEIKRFFMTVREAVGLVLQASAKSQGEERGQIFVLDMGDSIRIQDVARKMIRLANLEPDKDIKIVFTGLRPGEKLYEELFDSSEQPLETSIEGVMAARPQAIELSLLSHSFDEIEKAAKKGDRKEIYRLLKAIIKGYKKEDMIDPSVSVTMNGDIENEEERK